MTAAVSQSLPITCAQPGRRDQRPRLGHGAVNVAVQQGQLGVGEGPDGSRAVFTARLPIQHEIPAPVGVDEGRQQVIRPVRQ